MMCGGKMKKLLTYSLIAFALLTPSVTHAQSFKNCTEVRRVYPWGVARSKALAMKQKNYPTNNPHISASIYVSIQKMDRDNDGVACEK